MWHPNELKKAVADRTGDVVKLPVAEALTNLDEKMNFLFTIQQGVWTSNIEDAIELMQQTNNRVYNEL